MPYFCSLILEELPKAIRSVERSRKLLQVSTGSAWFWSISLITWHLVKLRQPVDHVACEYIARLPVAADRAGKRQLSTDLPRCF